MSDYLDTNGDPLRILYKIEHPINSTEGSELLTEGEVSDIYNRQSIVIPMHGVGAVGYHRPIILSLAKRTGDANYKNFKSVMVTFRYRRV